MVHLADVCSLKDVLCASLRVHRIGEVVREAVKDAPPQPQGHLRLPISLRKINGARSLLREMR